jgi:hypothetical protein
MIRNAASASAILPRASIRVIRCADGQHHDERDVVRLQTIVKTGQPHRDHRDGGDHHVHPDDAPERLEPVAQIIGGDERKAGVAQAKVGHRHNPGQRNLR